MNGKVLGVQEEVGSGVVIKEALSVDEVIKSITFETKTIN